MAGIGVFLLTLLLAIGGGHASILNFQLPVNVTGQVCCTQNGNCPGTPVAGTTVTLDCEGTLINPGVVATNTTTATGSFIILTNKFSIARSPVYIFDDCFITVQLPVPATAACPVLSNTGGNLSSLVRRVSAVERVQIGTTVGFVRANN